MTERETDMAATQAASSSEEEAAVESGTSSASGAVEPETAEPVAAGEPEVAPADELAADEVPAEERLDGEAAAAAVAPVEPDFHDQYLRAAAELDNVRKRARRDVAAAEGRGIARLARELLPALDDFERALAAAEAQPENQDHHLTDGIRLVQAQLLGALKRQTDLIGDVVERERKLQREVLGHVFAPLAAGGRLERRAKPTGKRKKG